MLTHRIYACLLLVCTVISNSAARAEEPAAQPKVIRAGIIGLDTSHVVAFTNLINSADPGPDIAGLRIVAAFPGGSPDLPSSIDRVAGFTEKVKGMGVEIVDSIPALLAKVDVVLLESVDGRPHLEQVRPVFEAGKPVFIDKPLAASLADGIAIMELGRKHNVPWFSASSLRFSPAANPDKTKVGDVVGAVAWSPCEIDPTHPDLFWYGIHGVETLFTIMGPGCATVTRTHTPDADVVTGVWSDGRIGTFRGVREGKKDYGAVVFGTKAITPTGGYAGYKPLVVEIAKFFKTGKPPVAPEDTIAILAFMEAAEESKRHGGKPVTIESVMEKAKAEAGKKLASK